MASPTPSPSIPELLTTWKGNFARNTSAAFDKLRLQDYIRLVVIIGAYALLRPYIIKLGGKLQAQQHERDAADNGAEIHPNDLRGKIEIPGLGDSDEEEDEEDTQPGQWGRNARVRQRKFIRDALAKEEARLAEEQEVESDKDIEEFLIG
ncbi:protein trafficking Pga2 [Massariosphaeria phaeospora]|uniref:Protein trafficking Pga2 n=1 Tax=Massariosphaeria phaeospora TaxID=100035 RepID=A0A7C8M1M2_9PLEO|nr:protein trafficking Pga2 [Massariosphaeria phaeospora]